MSGGPPDGEPAGRSSGAPRARRGEAGRFGQALRVYYIGSMFVDIVCVYNMCVYMIYVYIYVYI